MEFVLDSKSWNLRVRNENCEMAYHEFMKAQMWIGLPWGHESTKVNQRLAVITNPKYYVFDNTPILVAEGNVVFYKN